MPYLSKAINTNIFFKVWSQLFPNNNAQPNAFINGFVEDKRELLTLTLLRPVIEQTTVSFEFLLDNFVGDMDVGAQIQKWNKNSTLSNVSLLIDSVELENQWWMNPHLGSSLSPNYSPLTTTGQKDSVFAATIASIFLKSD